MQESKNTIGYKTVAAARKDLEGQCKADPSSVKCLNTEEGWFVVFQKSTVWSFTPNNHPAHPSVVKRSVESNNEQIYIKTEAKCESTKKHCDALLQQFQELNDKVREKMAENSK